MAEHEHHYVPQRVGTNEQGEPVRELRCECGEPPDRPVLPMPLPPEGYENAVDVPVQRPPRFDWWGWAPEPDTTGDGSGDPDKHFITIVDDGEEMAVIVHRTVGGKYPLDGRVALAKVERAKVIVAALNEYFGPHF